MKKNVLFSPLFLYNLALITHDATMSVNPSIQKEGAIKKNNMTLSNLTGSHTLTTIIFITCKTLQAILISEKKGVRYQTVQNF